MTDSDTSKIVLAKWSDRFIAWLIDFIIISAISTIVIFASFGSIDYEFEESIFWVENSQYIPTSAIFFVYWTILEYKTGQTIGKKILNLKSTNMYGKISFPEIISPLSQACIIPILSYAWVPWHTYGKTR